MLRANLTDFGQAVEDHYPLPTSSYALSKVASETIAGQIAQWSGIPFVALRFSNIMGPDDYEQFPSFWADARSRRWNLWGYIDERDVAAACRLALAAPADAVADSPSFIIAAADTVLNRPSAELMAEVFPGVPLTRPGRPQIAPVFGYGPQRLGRILRMTRALDRAAPRPRSPDRTET